MGLRHPVYMYFMYAHHTTLDRVVSLCTGCLCGCARIDRFKDTYMYICIFMHIIYIFVCVFVMHMLVRKYIWLRVYTQSHICIFICTHRCIYMYVYIYIHDVYIYIYIYIYIHVYTYVCLQVYIYIHLCLN